MTTWLAGLLLWGALVPLPRPVASQQGKSLEQVEEWVRVLDAREDPRAEEALEQLASLGEPAVACVLLDFESAAFGARRARTRLLAKRPLPEHAPRMLALLADPDPEVRRALVAALGNPALARAVAAERVQAFVRLLIDDPNASVRDAARTALAECALEEAVPALERALDSLPSEEAVRAASALAHLPTARERLLARLTAPAAGELAEGVRAALLLGYGRALAEVPGGGDELRERLPFLAGRVHPSDAVRAAATLTLTSFVARAAELSEVGRAERVLARLGEEGWPRAECLRRRLDLAWLQRGDPEEALELARDLVRAAQSLEPEEAERWELRARFFEGAAHLAAGRSEAAREVFLGLVQRLDGSREGRPDLFPSPSDAPWTRGGGAERIDRLHLQALAHLWQALIALEGGDAKGVVLRKLWRVHVLFLESRVVAQRTEAPDPSTLDSLLDRDLSPYTLVLFNERLAPERRGPALDHALALAEAWGQVAPLEMQGLGGAEAPERRLSDVFFDPVRLALLKEMRTAYRLQLLRSVRELQDPELGPEDPAELQAQLQLRVQLLRQLDQAETDENKALASQDGREHSSADLRAVYARLLDFLAPSMHAHTLAGELRAEGRSAEARRLCERALSTLSTAPLGSSLWSELSSARFELLRGSTLMDDGSPLDAERAYQDADRRLAAIEAQVKQRHEEQRAAGDTDLARTYQDQLRQIRALRGDALLSLAVNANVRQRNPARALEFFEQAYELNQSPFMQILRACYRARSGRLDEARTVLASVVPVPSLYYNIACTHALLGEPDAALDYLERDLRENHPTKGSLEQKRDWARKDPDLANVRNLPRFERLFGKTTE